MGEVSGYERWAHKVPGVVFPVTESVRAAVHALMMVFLYGAIISVEPVPDRFCARDSCFQGAEVDRWKREQLPWLAVSVLCSIGAWFITICAAVLFHIDRRNYRTKEEIHGGKQDGFSTVMVADCLPVTVRRDEGKVTDCFPWLCLSPRWMGMFLLHLAALGNFVGGLILMYPVLNQPQIPKYDPNDNRVNCANDPTPHYCTQVSNWWTSHYNPFDVGAVITSGLYVGLFAGLSLCSWLCVWHDGSSIRKRLETKLSEQKTYGTLGEEG